MKTSKKHIYLPKLKMCKPKETFKVPCTEVIIAEDENLVAIVSALTVSDEWILLPARLYKVFGREIAVGAIEGENAGEAKAYMYDTLTGRAIFIQTVKARATDLCTEICRTTQKCWKNWSATAWLVCYILTALTSFSKLIFKQKSQKMSLFS
ncbi:MAG: hypothetical protein N4Q53_00870 [Lactobacillus iners]|nr:hypothetical protein [Lactobacillus iners]